MLECLLALALLSVLAGLLVSWMTIASDSIALTGGSASWEASAHRALSLIQEDITTFDAEPKRPESARVRINYGELMIQTCHLSRTVTARYALSQGGTLQRSVGDVASQLMDGVATLSCELDEESEVLTIELRCSTGNRSVSRRYAIP